MFAALPVVQNGAKSFPAESIPASSPEANGAIGMGLVGEYRPGQGQDNPSAPTYSSG